MSSIDCFFLCANRKCEKNVLGKWTFIERYWQLIFEYPENFRRLAYTVCIHRKEFRFKSNALRWCIELWFRCQIQKSILYFRSRIMDDFLSRNPFNWLHFDFDVSIDWNEIIILTWALQRDFGHFKRFQINKLSICKGCCGTCCCYCSSC